MATKENLVIGNFDCSNPNFVKEVKRLNPEGNFLMKRNNVLLYKNAKRSTIKVPFGYLLKGNIIVDTKGRTLHLKKVPFLPRK